MTPKLNELSATELIQLLSTGKCSATEVTNACLSQIRSRDKEVNAWVYVDEALALRQSQLLDGHAAKGAEIKTLFGIPVGVKDVFNTIDMPTQMGSPIWQGFTPGNDARVVHYLRMEQAVILGKTVTAEFAVHAPGPTKNPFDPEYMPGTSSSGSAAAVSARMVPLALGTQTAGSILRPASYCGVYGFKPSFGLVPRTGVLKTTDTLDTIGGFARTPADLRLLFDTIRVKGRDFPVSEAALNDPRRRNRPADRPWRVGIIRGPKWNDAENYACKALLDYAKRIGGHSEIEVCELDLSLAVERAHEIHRRIYDRTLAYYFQREFKQGSLVSETMYAIVNSGNEITVEQYREALGQQQELADEVDAILEQNCDVAIGLTTGGQALKGLDSVDRPDNCLIWTLCGVPAINVPVFSGPEGLPYGCQVISRRFNDYMALQFVADLERWQLAGRVMDPVQFKEEKSVAGYASYVASAGSLST